MKIDNQFYSKLLYNIFLTPVAKETNQFNFLNSANPLTELLHYFAGILGTDNTAYHRTETKKIKFRKYSFICN